jgi:hypothetical protein
LRAEIRAQSRKDKIRVVTSRDADAAFAVRRRPVAVCGRSRSAAAFMRAPPAICLLDRSIAVMGPDDRDLPGAMGATGDQTVEFWSLFGSTGRSTKPPV